MNKDYNFKVRIVENIGERSGIVFGEKDNILEVKNGMLYHKTGVWTGDNPNGYTFESLKNYLSEQDDYQTIIELVKEDVVENIIRTCAVYKIIDELEESKYENVAFRRIKDNKIYKIGIATTGSIGLYCSKSSKGLPMVQLFAVNEEWEFIKDARLLELEKLQKQINEIQSKMEEIKDSINE